MIPSFFVREMPCKQPQAYPQDPTARSNRQSFNNMHEKQARLDEFHNRAMRQLGLDDARVSGLNGSQTERIPRPSRYR